MPRPAKRLATATTSRRLASSRWFLARVPTSATHSRSMRSLAARPSPPSASFRSAARPASIRLASSASCSAVSPGILLTCFRYSRTGSASSASACSPSQARKRARPDAASYPAPCCAARYSPSWG